MGLQSLRFSLGTNLILNCNMEVVHSEKQVLYVAVYFCPLLKTYS